MAIVKDSFLNDDGMSAMMTRRRPMADCSKKWMLIAFSVLTLLVWLQQHLKEYTVSKIWVIRSWHIGYLSSQLERSACHL